MCNGSQRWPIARSTMVSLHRCTALGFITEQKADWSKPTSRSSLALQCVCMCVCNVCVQCMCAMRCIHTVDQHRHLARQTYDGVTGGRVTPQ